MKAFARVESTDCSGYLLRPIHATDLAATPRADAAPSNQRVRRHEGQQQHIQGQRRQRGLLAEVADPSQPMDLTQPAEYVRLRRLGIAPDIATEALSRRPDDVQAAASWAFAQHDTLGNPEHQQPESFGRNHSG